MLTRLEVTNASGETLTLTLTNEDTGYIVQNIDGLGPVKANVVSSTFANLDGAQYQASRREVRNITIKLGIEPKYYNQTVQSLRQSLYSWFSPGSLITMRFHIGTGLDYDISGYVESMETALFTKDPVVDISILCMNPNFIDSDTLLFEGMSVDNLTEVDFTYTGTTPTGFLLTMLPDRNITSFDVYLRGLDGTQQHLSFTYALETDDQLAINTVVGEKSVILTRGSVESPVLYALSSASTWLQLPLGVSKLRVYVPGYPIPYTIVHRNAYGGL